MPGGKETPGGRVIVPEGAPEVGAAGAGALPAAALGEAGVKLGKFWAKTQEDSVPTMANIIIKTMMRDRSDFFISKIWSSRNAALY